MTESSDKWSDLGRSLAEAAEIAARAFAELFQTFNKKENK